MKKMFKFTSKQLRTFNTFLQPVPEHNTAVVSMETGEIISPLCLIR